MLADTRAKKRRIWQAIGGMHKRRRMHTANLRHMIPEDYIPRDNRATGDPTHPVKPGRRTIIMYALRMRHERIVLHGSRTTGGSRHRPTRLLGGKGTVPPPVTLRVQLPGGTFDFDNYSRMEVILGRKRGSQYTEQNEGLAGNANEGG